MGTSGQSVTLANSIIGVGVLAMPFCFQQCGVVLATLMLLVMGLVSRLSCYFLLKSAFISRRWNFEFLGFHIFGPAGKLAVEIGIIGFLMGTCIAYFVVVGDLGPQIIAKMLNINQSDVLRTSVMVLVSVVCVLPLGLLRNVDSLSNVSAATVGFYVCLVLKVISEAVSKLLYSDWNTEWELWKPSGVLQCMPIFSMALFCQTQLFEIFESLPTLSLEKMNEVTKNAINICTVVYLTLGLFGYIAFGSQEISGNVLVSLSTTWASDVIKLGFVMSVAFSFPLIIFPCRASLYSLMYRKVHSSHHDNIINHSIPEATFRCITIGIIIIALLVSLMIPNIELVLGLVGSTIGVMICIIFPSACFINVTFKNTNEKLLAKVILMLGLLILVLGTYANLQAAESQLDRYDEKYITQEKIDKIVQDFFESNKLQKSEDVIGKPFQNVKDEGNKNSKETHIESEVQPPNPVPPESKENRESKQNIPEQEIISNKIKHPLVPDKAKEVIQDPERIENKIVESHPKNVNVKISNEPQQSNGVSKEQKEVKAKSSDNQDKIDMIKKQQLVDTIKQHGEEQKELIKEQKEILDELHKTKQELQQNKKKEDDAKKIAMESIQKIANIAIQSLGGVTEKQAQISQENVQQIAPNLENVANKAVEEIAKQAVETLEAIKDESKNVQSPQQNQAAHNADAINTQNAQLIQDNNDTKQQQNIENKQAQEQSDIQPKQLAKEGVNKKEINEPIINGHSHTADEPKSYMQGEDIQMQKNKLPIDTNVPIPVAMNPNGQIVYPVPNDPPVPVVNNVPVNQINPVQNNIPLNKDNLLQKNLNIGALDLNRQKREVVDCTEKSLLQPGDKQICDTLLINKNPQADLLPKPDLSVIGLPRSLPLDSNVLYHLRSLKTIEETEKSR